MLASNRMGIEIAKNSMQNACTVRVAEQEIGQREPKESIREKPPLQREERDPFMRPQAPSEIPQFQTHFCIHGMTINTGSLSRTLYSVA